MSYRYQYFRRCFFFPASCATAAGAGGARRVFSGCDDPQAALEPSAPTLQALRSSSEATQQPPFNPQVVNEAVNKFLQSPDGRAVIHATITQNLRVAVAEEMKRARKSEEAAFAKHARRVAEGIAAAAAKTEIQLVHDLIEAAVSAAVKSQTEQEVCRVIQENPKLKRFITEQLQHLRAEVREAVEWELAEICDEERHQRVNKAFLAALDRRANEILQRTQEKCEQSVKEAQRPLRTAQALGVVAVVMAFVGFYARRS
eukprot:TRINITY_DN12114_c0_g1_i1.p1 TRINITY_DN12114_c0_g1~~TRINITY_DN12114_c0_g1_i1.p1  ORF type:complete len:258 (-),score=46.89 TRINITY_DN12114_c0_g1_i1:170-943(-)